MKFQSQGVTNKRRARPALQPVSIKQEAVAAHIANHRPTTFAAPKQTIKAVDPLPIGDEEKSKKKRLGYWSPEVSKVRLCSNCHVSGPHSHKISCV